MLIHTHFLYSIPHIGIQHIYKKNQDIKQDFTVAEFYSSTAGNAYCTYRSEIVGICALNVHGSLARKAEPGDSCRDTKHK